MDKFYIVCRVAREDEKLGEVYSAQIVEAGEDTFFFAHRGSELGSCHVCRTLKDAEAWVEAHERDDTADCVYDPDPILMYVERGELVYAGGAALPKA